MAYFVIALGSISLACFAAAITGEAIAIMRRHD